MDLNNVMISNHIILVLQFYAGSNQEAIVDTPLHRNNLTSWLNSL